MTASPTILALVTDAFGGRGGIAQYNRDLLGALAGCGAAVTIVPREAAPEAQTPAAINQVRPRRGRFAYALAALRAARDRRPGVVFCGHLYMAPLALLIARLTRARLVMQLHGVEAWQAPGALARRAVEAADLVMCVSRYTRARLLSWSRLEPARALVLPNTVGSRFTPGEAAALRAAWGLAGKRVLLSVGRLSARERYKGQDRVIRALPGLLRAGHDVVYLIVGEGDDRARLAALAAAAGVAEHVRFMGALDGAALADAYRLADLFVMPSTGEGFGIAFLEAMASGTPALGLAAGGAVDALGDGDLGILTTEAELPVAIARALDAARVDGPALAAAVARRFGREAFASGVNSLLVRLAEAA